MLGGSDNSAIARFARSSSAQGRHRDRAEISGNVAIMVDKRTRPLRPGRRPRRRRSSATCPNLDPTALAPPAPSTRRGTCGTSPTALVRSHTAKGIAHGHALDKLVYLVGNVLNPTTSTRARHVAARACAPGMLPCPSPTACSAAASRRLRELTAQTPSHRTGPRIDIGAGLLAQIMCYHITYVSYFTCTNHFYY